MANVTLPKGFKEKLIKNNEIDGIITTTLSTFGEILEEKSMFFFSEYTDHGIKHIEQVLVASDNLITDDTFSNILGYKDIGYYILAVILHDIGMHIDFEGFKCLISGKYDDIRFEELDSSTWSELWEDFLNEARKFSGKQLTDLFGRDDVIIRRPPLQNIGEISEDDKKLIGEFIRRHHPRLAHEISIKGFPAKENIITFAGSLDVKAKDLVGLIARSHGKDLRICVDYIESKYGKESRKCPFGIHVTYLMILLRISDYIQIDNQRIYKTILKSKTFSSPISKYEHYAHLSIENIDFKYQDDPERIFVTAFPDESKMFLKLKKLLKDIQYEFDISWAVLGELYGNSQENDKPKIKYRRITSNLDTKSFTQQQNYVADSFLFKTNDDIIKLLVAPLYGDDISFGVRELLQNSIDACKEKEFINEQEKVKNYIPSVVIKVEKADDGETYFEITDNGLGMDIDIIKNYFLSAGASYRKSLEWRKDFLNEDGTAKVRRSGRFGVGILSAFLIGKEINIQTKKNKIGYKFKANLNTEQINVLKDSNIPEGTSIKIKIDNDKIKEFEKEKYQWTKWYTLDAPKVEYFLYGKKIIAFKKTNPENNNALPINWNSIDSQGYNKILWSYSHEFAKTKLTCNGIVINKGVNLLPSSLVIQTPYISVFDNNAILPLTLDRNSVSSQVSFKNEIIEDIYKDFIAYFLLFDDNSYVKNKKIFSKKSKLDHPSLYNEYYTSGNMGYGINQYKGNNYGLSQFLNTILISKKGFILNYNYFIRKLNGIDAILMQLDFLPDDSFDLDIKDRFLFCTDEKTNSISDYKNVIEPSDWNHEKGEWEDFDTRIFIQTEKYNYLFNSTKKRVSDWLNHACDVQYINNNFTCLHLDSPKASVFDESFFSRYSDNIHFIREYKINCLHEGDPILNALLQKYIGDDVVIPFSLKERRKKYPLAFKELERYMEKYIG